MTIILNLMLSSDTSQHPLLASIESDFIPILQYLKMVVLQLVGIAHSVVLVQRTGVIGGSSHTCNDEVLKPQEISHEASSQCSNDPSA